MLIHLRYFASLREALGMAQQTLHTQVTTVGALRQELMDQLQASNPLAAAALGQDRAVRAALNQTLCDEFTLLHEGCEVAFFPPVTGG